MENDNNKLIDTVKERLERSPERIKNLFEEGLIDRVLNETSNQYKLATWQKKLLDNEVTLVLLIFLSRAGMVERLTESLEINKETAQKIFQDVNSKLFGLVNDLLSVTESELFAIDPNDLRQESFPTPEELPEEPQPRSVQPIRTMEGDLKRIHGYGSFGELYGDGSEEPVYKTEQDTVVKKPNLATTPTYRPQPSGQETDQNNT